MVEFFVCGKSILIDVVEGHLYRKQKCTMVRGYGVLEEWRRINNLLNLLLNIENLLNSIW